MFGICLFCACRINEAVTLQVADVYAPNGQVRPELIIRKGNTKGKLATRTALTQMSDAGVPLRIVQEVSGHRNLSQLQKYLEVRPDQVRGAIASLAMISPVGNASLGSPESDGKWSYYHDTPQPHKSTN